MLRSEAARLAMASAKSEVAMARSVEKDEEWSLVSTSEREKRENQLTQSLL